MFTGLVRHGGFIFNIENQDVIVRILNAPETTRVGDSVAINGVCLTVTDIDAEEHLFRFHVMQETQNVTTFHDWKIGNLVNVEFAMRAGDRLDGHIVSGHVMGTAVLAEVEEKLNKWTFHTELARLLTHKGSVAVDGVSLTVVDARENVFTVCIIPHTFSNTIFNAYAIGTAVNIECPVMGESEKIKTHDQGMAAALEEGRKGRATAPPNPWVGCVLVDAETNHVVARGYHERPGEAHAEVVAFQNLKDETRKVLVYVTLEPCCHHGRTPPCTEFLIARKHMIEQVVIGMEDPDPRVSMNGANALIAGGIDVHILQDARVLDEYRAYIKHRKSGLPYVIYKIATTINGKMTQTLADSTHSAINTRRFTSESAQEDVHETRHNVQCIFTSTRTVRADQPRLNVRRKGIPNETKPVFVIGSSDVDTACIESETIVSFGDVLTALREAMQRGYMTCLVEAGPTLYNAMMELQCVDEVHWYVANTIGTADDVAWDPVSLLPTCRETKTFDTTVKIMYTL